MAKILVCPRCKQVDPMWHYANGFNSTKFSGCCGVACDEYDVYDWEVESFERQHREFLKRRENNGGK